MIRSNLFDSKVQYPNIPRLMYIVNECPKHRVVILVGEQNVGYKDMPDLEGEISHEKINTAMKIGGFAYILYIYCALRELYCNIN